MLRNLRGVFLLFLILLLTGEINASHYSDGMIWYEHVGGPNEHKYVLKGILIANLGAASINQNSMKLDYRDSQANKDSSYLLNIVLPPFNLRHPANASYWRIDPLWECGLRTPSSWNSTYAYLLYQSDTVLLDANRIYDFSFEGFCCRDVYSNLNGAGGSNMLLRSYLDTHYPPSGLRPPNFTTFQTIIPKGLLTRAGSMPLETDSTQLSWSPVYTGTRARNASTIPYLTGFNTNILFGTGGSSQLFQNQSRFLELNAPNIGRYKVGLKKSRYQFDTTAQAWVETGWYVADFSIIVSNDVDSSNFLPVQLDSLSNAVNGLCGSKEIILYSPAAVLASSLDSSGIQFGLYKPDGNPNPVIGASLIDSFRIKLELLEAIDSNGTYRIEPRVNLSGKYLQGGCGYPLPTADLFFSISGCNPLSSAEFRQELKVYPNPNNGLLNLSGFPEGSSIAIYNLQGQKVWQQTAQNKIKLDLKAGIYTLILRSSSGESLVQEKLLVQ